MTVVKVQLALSPVDAPALVYARGRTRIQHVHFGLDEVKRQLGADKRGFFDAEWDHGAGWIIGRRVGDEFW